LFFFQSFLSLSHFIKNVLISPNSWFVWKSFFLLAGGRKKIRQGGAQAFLADPKPFSKHKM
jgi:hypothetical protein